MSQSAKPIPLAEFVRDAAKLIEELAAQGQPLLLEDQGRTFRLSLERRPRRRKQTLSRDDPIFDTVGMFTEKEPSDMRNKHEYLAQAYEAHIHK